MLNPRDLGENDILRIAQDPDAVWEILEAAGLMTMAQVAERLGISYYRVKILRGRRTQLDLDAKWSGQTYQPRSDALPPSIPVPGDPLWHPAEIETWGRQTGRLDNRGKPMRALPTGRPRRRVAKAAA